MENLKRLFKEANVDLKTMIVFHKAERLIRASEAQLNSLYLKPCTAKAIFAFKI